MVHARHVSTEVGAPKTDVLAASFDVAGGIENLKESENLVLSLKTVWRAVCMMPCIFDRTEPLLTYITARRDATPPGGPAPHVRARPRRPVERGAPPAARGIRAAARPRAPARGHRAPSRSSTLCWVRGRPLPCTLHARAHTRAGRFAPPRSYTGNNHR